MRKRKSDADRFVPQRSQLSVSQGNALLTRKLKFSGSPYGKQLESILHQDENYRVLPLTAGRIKQASLQENATENASPGTVSSPPRSVRRKLPTSPEQVLDAANLLDDFYLNVLDWSSKGVVAIALGGSVYLWNSESQAATCLTTLAENVYVSSLQFKDDVLAVGDCTGRVSLWDVGCEKLVRPPILVEDLARIPVLSWNPKRTGLLSAGTRTGKMHHIDIRSPKKTFAVGLHTQEICGLKWALDGDRMGSGANDNLVKVWDMRSQATRHVFTAHSAAVKALGWCPWRPSMLVSGGGSLDRRLCFWNTLDGTLMHSIDTGSQICALVFSELYHELVTAHGFAGDNLLMVWKLPQYRLVGSIPAHHSRVLHLALSPDGCTVASAAGDDSLKFWRLFERKTSVRLSEKKDLSLKLR